MAHLGACTTRRTGRGPGLVRNNRPAQPAYRSPLRAFNLVRDLADPRSGRLAQNLIVKAQVFFDEAGDEEIAMVVAFPAYELNWIARLLTGREE